MANKKITDLNSYSSSQVQPNDLLFITDISHQETKKITASDFVEYAFNESGSGFRTGSFTGSFAGVADVAKSLVYPNFTTASRADTASFALNAKSSSIALTASYALAGTGLATLSETVYQLNHSFNIGDAAYITYTPSNTRTFLKATSSYMDGGNANEVVGVVQSINGSTFTIVYSGLISFQSNPTYFSQNQFSNGASYFLNGLGTLSLTDPSKLDSSQISKPVMIQMTSASALVINQRGLYDKLGGQITASYLYYDGITPNGTASFAMNALTASYALNGGSGGSGSVVSVYPTSSFYFDTIPVGTIIPYVSGSAPSGWLACDGGFYPLTDSNNQPTAYVNLYNALSQSNSSTATFGKRYNYDIINQQYLPNPSGKYFNVPDLRGIFIRGGNTGLANNGGIISTYDSGSRQYGSLQTDAFKAHSHGYKAVNVLGNVTGVNTGTTNFGTGQTDASGDVETRPVNVSVYYYIKYSQYVVSDPIAQAISNGSYPISGDVGGAISASVVKGIYNIPIASTAQTPQSGAVLQYNGTNWTPTSLSGLFASIYRAGSVSVSGLTGSVVTFSSPMPSTNYSVAVSWNTGNSGANCYITGALSTTGFTIFNGGSSVETVRWIAIINN